MQEDDSLFPIDIITLDDIRRFYFENTRSTLRIEDARYLQERAIEMGLNHSNGGLEALFSSLNYRFEGIRREQH